jgi:N utilization substance protein A
MQALAGAPTTPIEQVNELGEGIIQKLVAAGVTTVEGLADMTPEQLEEIPGIGEKTLEKISVAVRHYFGHFEEGEEGRPAEGAAEGAAESVETPESAAALEGEAGMAEVASTTAEPKLENADELTQEAESQGEPAAESAAKNAAEAGAEDLAEPEQVKQEERGEDGA